MEENVEENVEKRGRKAEERGRNEEKEGLIITVLSKAPKTTINELVEITGMSRRGIEDMLKRMKQSGKIRRVGATKGGHWEVINQ